MTEVQNTRWKFVHYFDAPGGYPDEYELYDLEHDPTEYTNQDYNLDYAEKRKKMEVLLDEVSRQKLLVQPQPFDKAAFADWHQQQD